MFINPTLLPVTVFMLQYMFAHAKYKGHCMTNSPNALLRENPSKSPYDFALLDPWKNQVFLAWNKAICSIVKNMSPLLRTTSLSWCPHISPKDSDT